MLGENMKINRLYLPLLSVILFPYIILLALFCFFNNNIMETLFNNNGIYLLSLLIILYIISLICSISVFIKNILFKQSSQILLRMNMIIKLIHIPAYVIIFFIGLIFLGTIFTMGISLVLMLLDGLAIFLSGLLGLSGIIRGVIEKNLSKKDAVIHAILQFVFCVDIISSIKIYKKINAK
jgi:hypothetical protein